MYHSFSYIRRNKTASDYVIVRLNNQLGESSVNFGQALFFFYFNGQPFIVLRQFFRLQKKFSSFFPMTENNETVGSYLDKFYSMIYHSKSKMMIYSCCYIQSKCILIQYDDVYSFCTPVELELEHD